MHRFIVFENGQNGPLDNRDAGQMLPAGANVLYVQGTDETGKENETWLASPCWPYWQQRDMREEKWQNAAIKPGETLGAYVAQCKANCE